MGGCVTIKLHLQKTGGGQNPPDPGIEVKRERLKLTLEGKQET